MRNRYYIICTDKEMGNTFLDNLANEMRYGDVLTLTHYFNYGELILKNGDTYKVITTSQISNKLRCEKAYVQDDVPVGMIINIVNVMTSQSKLPEEDRLEIWIS